MAVQSGLPLCFRWGSNDDRWRQWSTSWWFQLDGAQASEEGVYLSRHGKINFVDLAGSEMTKKTNSQGKTLEEANNINKSLMVLGKSPCFYGLNLDVDLSTKPKLCSNKTASIVNFIRPFEKLQIQRTGMWSIATSISMKNSKDCSWYFLHQY